MIYEYLGIKEEDILNINISKKVIIDNISEQVTERKAKLCFENIDRITLKLSINRNEHYLQVIEVILNSPSDLEIISEILQKTIKYRVLFVFLYEDRYLISWRNFQLTKSTERVNTVNVSKCTKWIYKEYLGVDTLLTCDVHMIENLIDEDYQLPKEICSKSKDDGEFVYFEDIFDNVNILNQTMIEINVVSLRYLLDWINFHNLRERIDLNLLLDELVEREAYIFKDEHLFFDKIQVEAAIQEIEYSKYGYSVEHTGRNPMRYFEEFYEISTYDDENEMMVLVHSMISKKSVYSSLKDEILDDIDRANH